MFTSRALAAVILAVFVIARPDPLALAGDQVVLLRAGTPVFAVFSHTVDSDSVKEGDIVYLQVMRPVTVDDVVVIRSGQKVVAKVAEVRDAGGWGRKGKLSIRVESTNAVDGQQIFLSGTERQAGQGKTGKAAGWATGLGLVCFPPAALIGFAIRGEEGVFHEGYEVKAFTDTDHKINVAEGGGRKETARSGGRTESNSITSPGTCFAVRPNGVLLTAYHVVQHAKSIRVRLADGTIAGAKLQSISPHNDLAILSINVQTPYFLPLAPARAARVGERVFTADLLGREPKLTEGSVSALSGIKGEPALLQMSVPVGPGNSGGPVVNESGEVVGVVTSSAAVKALLSVTGTLPQNVNWAVKADYARPLFDVPTVKSLATSRTQAIEWARRATCVVEPSSF